MGYSTSKGRAVSRYRKKYNQVTMVVHKNTRDRLREFADEYNITYDCTINCLIDYFEEVN